jgi:hypothetical protein
MSKIIFKPFRKIRIFVTNVIFLMKADSIAVSVLHIWHFRKWIRNPAKVLNAVLEKDGDQLDRSCVK